VVSCEPYRRVEPGRQTADQKPGRSAHMNWLRTIETKQFGAQGYGMDGQGIFSMELNNNFAY
jgi:hypothetical protein